MNWEAIGAVGEIVGASAVFASLIYLALQVRGQNKESRISAMHEISVGLREVMSKFTTLEMTPLVTKANKNYDQLSDEEVMCLFSLCAQYFLAFEEAFIQFQDGRLAKRSWKTYSAYYSNGLGMTAVQKYWELRKKYFDEEFVRYIDSLSLDEYTLR